MTDERLGPLTYENFLSDPLIRLVMESDGVSVAEMVAVLEAARDALLRRQLPPQVPKPC